MSNSQSREGLVDLPLDAAAWLIHFKSQNQTLLKSGNVRYTFAIKLYVSVHVIGITER